MQNNTTILDCNSRMINVGDIVNLFGMIGTVHFECGAYGIGFDEIDWDRIDEKIYDITGYEHSDFCRNDNFISFWELIWNFNCEDNCCNVVEIMDNM